MSFQEGAPHICAMRGMEPRALCCLSIHSPLSCTQPPHPCLYSNLREADILSSFCRCKNSVKGTEGVQEITQPRRAKWGPDNWVPFSQPKLQQASLHLQIGRVSKLTTLTSNLGKYTPYFRQRNSVSSRSATPSTLLRAESASAHLTWGDTHCPAWGPSFSRLSQ